MTNTPRNSIPLMASAAAQKHATFSAAMKILDPLINPAVLNTLATPPESPAEGSVYRIASAGATGAWAGQENKLAYYINAVWEIITPTLGMFIYEATIDAYFYWNGTTWKTSSVGGGGSVPVELSVYVPGLLTSNQVIYSYIGSRSFQITSGMPNSAFKAVDPAAASTVLSIRKNGIEVGTISFVASGTTGTISLPSTQSFTALTDKLEIVGPTTADTSLGNITGVIYGVRT